MTKDGTTVNVKKSEVLKDDDNNNKYCITVRNQMLGPPLISLERLKVQSSNLAGRLTVRDTNTKMKNGSKGGVA